MTRQEYEDVICLGGHVVRVSQSVPDSATALAEADLHVDGAPVHTWTFPSWQRLRWGVHQQGLKLLIWTARELRIVDIAARRAVVAYRSNEDLKFVHFLREQMVLICETSVRLTTDRGEETARLEVPEVVVDAWVEGDRLYLRDQEGAVLNASVHDGTLVGSPR